MGGEAYDARATTRELTQLEVVCIEDLVSEDPELILRMLLLGYLFNLSANRLLQEVRTNAAFRWFCRLSFGDALPHRTTLIKVRRRWGLATFPKIFDAIVKQCVDAGLVRGEHLILDGTQIEANAAINSLEALEPADSTERYLDRLEQELGASTTPSTEEDSAPPSPGDGDAQAVSSTAAEPEPVAAARHRQAGDPDFRGERFRNATHRSRTDPDARLYRKSPGQEARLCYLGHYLIDAPSGVIVGAMATLATGTAEREAGIALLDHVLPQLPTPADRRTLSADAAYNAGGFLADVLDRDVDPLIPMPTLEPEPLPRWQRRTSNLDHARKRRQKLRAAIARNRTRKLNQSRRYRQAQARRCRIEHRFAEAKQWHGLDRAKGRGLAAVHEQTLMTGAVQNLKRLAKAHRQRSRPAAPAVMAKQHLAKRAPLHPPGQVFKVHARPFCIRRQRRFSQRF
ncbi:MAG TPA: transposase [Bacillota bacterium]